MKIKLIEEYVLKLDNCYNEKGIAEKVGYHTYTFPYEILDNAYHHGEAKIHGVCFGIFYSPETVVIGCNDGGDYFKDLGIKEKWENKEFVKTTSKIGNCHNNGIRTIYHLTDEIFIDTNSGTFFGKFDPWVYDLSFEEMNKVFKKRCSF